VLCFESSVQCTVAKTSTASQEIHKEAAAMLHCAQCRAVSRVFVVKGLLCLETLCCLGC
jgi:hypothetical protein